MDRNQLIKLAFDVREHSYSPYSHYAVGAALLCSSGKVYLGANVDNASFSGAICAERAAAVSATSKGERQFEAIAVVGGPHGAAFDGSGGEASYAFPCGYCRQFLREFAAPGMKVYVARARPIGNATVDDKNIVTTTLEELLPNSFGPEQMGQ